jgi:hypothetical protein
MAKPDQEKLVVKAWLVASANWLAALLDMRPPSKVENTGEQKRWTLRRTVFSILGVSLVLWAVGFLAFRYLVGP